MAKVSIIVPVYNTKDCLPACLESLFTQREPDIEVVCVDDGSTDQSPAILRHYAGAEPRLKLVTNTANQGVSMARNIGFRAAMGEYIAFVDSDDCLKPDFCQKLYEAARRTGADIAKGNYAYLHHDRIDYGINRKIREDKTNFYVQLCSAIYRAAFLKKHNILFPPDLHAAEDLVFAFKAANHANKVAIVDDAHILINVRFGSASFAAPDYRTIRSYYRAFTEILRVALDAGVEKASFNHVLASLFALSIHVAARNRSPEVRDFVIAKNEQLFKAVQASPQWDPGLFAGSLQESDKPLYECLEANTLEVFLKNIDKMQAQRCRTLRSRAHDTAHSS